MKSHKSFASSVASPFEGLVVDRVITEEWRIVMISHARKFVLWQINAAQTRQGLQTQVPWHSWEIGM